MLQIDKFIEYVETNCDLSSASEDINEVLDWLRIQNNKTTKAMFTETGLDILTYMQNSDTRHLKSKDIADGMETTSRKVSGAIRKLVSDGYVEGFGSSPIAYSLTEKGRNFDINNYKETIING